MKSLLDERVVLEDILENGFSNNSVSKFEMIILAKHYKWNKGYGKTRIKKSLIDFCKENDTPFNHVISRDFLNDVVRIAEGSEFRKPVPIQITDEELRKIRLVKNYDYQKILFVLLSFSKTLKYMVTDVSGKSSYRKPIGYYINIGVISRVKKACNLRVSNNDMLYILHELYKLEYIEPTYFNSVRILYADDTGMPKIFVKDFDNIADYYIEYTGGELLYCKECGVEFKKTGNKKDFCDDCYAEKRREQVRKNVARHRDRNG